MSTNTKCLCMKVDENLQCEICNKSFSDIKQLLHHFDCNHDNQNFIPSIKHLSNEFSTSRDTQLAHNAIKESDILQYHFCEKNLQRHALPKHMQQVHAKTQFVCEICYKTFFSKDYVNKHKIFLHES